MSCCTIRTPFGTDSFALCRVQVIHAACALAGIVVAKRGFRNVANQTEPEMVHLSGNPVF